MIGHFYNAPWFHLVIEERFVFFISVMSWYRKGYISFSGPSDHVILKAIGFWHNDSVVAILK